MRYFKLLIIFPLLFSCKKDKPEETPALPSKLSNGVLVLCEGLFQQNNSSVSWIDQSNSSVNNQFFLKKAGRELGDTGNDIQRYGGKIYVVVNVSSTIEVMDAVTFSPIKQINMTNGSVSKQPRFITFNGSKAYVSCFDGFVDVIDTSSLEVVQRIAVGPNPEGLAVSNNKLYVANSGGLNFSNMDSTLSVIDLTSHTELTKITIGLNPGRVLADQSGDIYAIIRGDYAAVPSRMVRVDAVNDQLMETFNFDAGGIEEMGDRFLITYQNPAGTSSNIALFNPLNEQMVDMNYISTSGITTLFGVQFNSFNNSIYVADAMNYVNTGYIRVYSTSGSLINTYHVGLNPSKMLFYE